MSRFAPLCVVPALAALVALGSLAAPLSARAQSINVDFGTPGTAPTDTYAAAGAPGHWNTIGVLDPYVRAPLVDTSGHAIAADIYMYGPEQMLTYPVTTGNNGALMNDMLIGFNDPVDVCLWLENLVEDDYEILIYAMTPNDPSLMCRVRVDDGTPGPTMVGGAWPGSQVEGVTYERFVVHATGGGIAFHSGLYGGYLQSGMNGFQIRPLSSSGVGAGAPGGSAGGRAVLGITPNPARGGDAVAFALPREAEGVAGTLEVIDTAGRVVWSHRLSASDARGAVTWDGRDAHGRAVPAGVFLVSWSPSGGGVRVTSKLVRVR